MAFRDKVDLFLGKWGRMRRYKAPFTDGRGYIIFTINTKPNDSDPVMQGIRIVDRGTVPDNGLLFRQGEPHFSTSADIKALITSPVSSPKGFKVINFNDVDISHLGKVMFGWRNGSGKLYLHPGKGTLQAGYIRFNTIGATKTTSAPVPKQNVYACFNLDIIRAPEMNAENLKGSVSFYRTSGI